MSAAEGRTANRVEVPQGDSEQRDCACALCTELARALPDVRELFKTNARLFRENAELRIELHEERLRLKRILDRAAKLPSKLDRIQGGALGDYLDRR
ncbi:hypothetical protein [Adlercreutzia shanghongiae]|uniref:Uncharacterized protein n=1 Tax=Adlercreutzia shanghongiae TaxID=3111773 RepID=A0ABU6IW06_9ACTN|nr:hypothetical protein [Adlercreutzia sp. R22]MEC4294018.1 hypothetical protein [Adlercreutzia sp. R22]